MKILAIRGRNLASLREDFVVDLEAGPLAGAGLFAISGPTGSGKSTLLDAMCLALFDATPRLGGRSTVSIGAPGEDEKLRVGTRDVRALLSRGAGEGYAEVDFLGIDGATYRATWRVSRARQRPGGRLQEQDIQLVERSTGRVLSEGTKSRTLEVIQSKLGLSFDQFKRSVLLAQGEFAAFLRASGGERAELLERITGTSVFAQVGRTIYERARELTAEWNAERVRQEGIGALSPEERDALGGRVEALRQEKALSEEALARATAALTWLRERLARAEAVRQAEKVLASAEEEVESTRPLLQMVADEEKVVPLRAALRRQIERREHWEALVRQRQTLQGKVGELDQARAAAIQAVDQAVLAKEAAVARQQELLPIIAEARRQDGALEALNRSVDAEASKLRQAEDRVGSRQVELKRCVEKAESVGKQAELAADWLRAHNAEVQVAPLWPSLRPRLVAWAQAEHERAQAVEHIVARQSELPKAQGERDAAESHLAAAAEELSQADRAAHQAEAALEVVDTGSLELERRTIEAAAARATEAAALCEAARACALRMAQAEATAAEAARSEAQQEENARIAEAENREASLRLEEASRALDLAKSRLSFDEHRAQLVSGEPCPLCGAVEHPYSGAEHAVFAGWLAEAEGRVKELRDQVRVGSTAQAQALAEAKAARETGVRAKAEFSREELEQRQRVAKWGELAAGELAVGEGADGQGSAVDVALAIEAWDRVAAWLSERTAMLHSQRIALAEEETKLGAARQQAKVQRTKRDSARERADLARERMEQAERALAHARAELAALQSTEREALGKAREAWQSLETGLRPLPSWEERVRASPKAFAQQLDAAVLQVATRQEELRLAEVERANVAAEVQRHQASLSEEVRSQEAAKQSATDSAEALKAAEIDRAKLLSGRSADLVERELASELGALAKKFEQAHAMVQRAEVQLAETHAAISALEEPLKQAEQASLQAQLEVEAARVATGLPPERVEVALATPPAEVAKASERVSAAERAARESKVRCDERRALLNEHEAKTPEGSQGSEGDLVAAVQQARLQSEAIGEEHAAAIGRLREDDERQTKAALARELLDRIEGKKRIWDQLSALVGSADGKKFRVLAQGFALEELLDEANHRLVELNPRYQLEPVSGYDLELQVVDLDLGREVRSLTTLSGGESFLVSLALALGLSAMAADRVAVRSLFIDEGFGTLDAHSLDTALAALDALQSTGRQVGVISHVEGLEERLGAGLRVIPQGAGRSHLAVVGSA